MTAASFTPASGLSEQGLCAVTIVATTSESTIVDEHLKP